MFYHGHCTDIEYVNSHLLPMIMYFTFSISLLIAVLCFLIWTFSFSYSLWFHIFDIPYDPLLLIIQYYPLIKKCMYTSLNLLLIFGHLIWLSLHPYFYLADFFWISSSLIFCCLYFLWTIFLIHFTFLLTFPPLHPRNALFSFFRPSLFLFLL